MPQHPIPISLLISINLTGCAGDKDTLLPADGATIERIYHEHFADLGLNGTLTAREAVAGRALGDAAADLSGYVRDAYDELDRQFPRLPNPTLVLYVFPHLAGAERVPIPGYTTTFSLYRQVEYALPGEHLRPWPREPERD